MLYIDFLKNNIYLELKLLEKNNFFTNKPNFNFSVENIPNQIFGEVSSNVAMINAKNINTNLFDLAEKIKKKLLCKNELKKIEIIKPGFINFTFTVEYWHEQLCLFASKSPKNFYTAKKKKKINIEYVSANPTGLMHIGHTRGAVLGDVLASILQSVGHDVVREYYINDAGNQISSLMNTIYFHLNIDSGKRIDQNEIYPGDYLKEISKKIAKKFKNFDPKYNYIEIKREVIKIILDDIRSDLRDLSINHDNFVSENSLLSKFDVKKFISYLKEKDLIYEGFQDPPKGIESKNWKKQKQLLFKSKESGDDSDRALIKPDGAITYFMSDIIYHQDKLNRNYDSILNIWGADHHGYVFRIKKAVKYLSKENINFEILLTALVNLIKDKRPIKMSKRKGDYITLKQVLKEVGKDAIRFMMISRSHDKVIDFDFDLVKEKTKDNQVFYVKYAYARCASIKRSTQNILEKGSDNISFLKLKEEINLIKKLVNYSFVIRKCAESLEPHRLTNYLYELSKQFHNYWSLGNIDYTKKIVISNNKELTNARLFLINNIQIILKDGLDILKIEAPEEM